MTFERLLHETKARRERDAQRFREINSDECMCCHASGPDKRALWVDCSSAVCEVAPEAIDVLGVGNTLHKAGYYLRICKNCRSRFLAMLEAWWQTGVDRRDVPKDPDGDDLAEDTQRDIPARIDGSIVMLTLDEWTRRHADRLERSAESQ